MIVSCSKLQSLTLHHIKKHSKHQYITQKTPTTPNYTFEIDNFHNSSKMNKKGFRNLSEILNTLKCSPNLIYNAHKLTKRVGQSILAKRRNTILFKK